MKELISDRANPINQSDRNDIDSQIHPGTAPQLF